MIRNALQLQGWIAAEAFQGINNFLLVVLKKTSEKSVEVVMISQESTTKDVKLVGCDYRGHTSGTLVVGIAYGCPYDKGSAVFSLVFFLSATSEKLFIPYKGFAPLQALKFGQESCPAGE